MENVMDHGILCLIRGHSVPGRSTTICTILVFMAAGGVLYSQSCSLGAVEETECLCDDGCRAVVGVRWQSSEAMTDAESNANCDVLVRSLIDRG